jgi:hypothetical protein
MWRPLGCVCQRLRHLSWVVARQDRLKDQHDLANLILVERQHELCDLSDGVPLFLEFGSCLLLAHAFPARKRRPNVSADLLYEQIVVDHQDEFSPRAIWFARHPRGRSEIQPGRETS